MKTPNMDQLRKGILMIEQVTGHPASDWVCNHWFDKARVMDDLAASVEKEYKLEGE